MKDSSNIQDPESHRLVIFLSAILHSSFLFVFLQFYWFLDWFFTCPFQFLEWVYVNLMGLNRCQNLVKKKKFLCDTLPYFLILSLAIGILWITAFGGLDCKLYYPKIQNVVYECFILLNVSNFR